MYTRRAVQHIRFSDAANAIYSEKLVWRDAFREYIWMDTRCEEMSLSAEHY